MSFIIRPYESSDFKAIYEVCLKTGDAGKDATQLYDDPTILGHLYVGPYVTLESDLAFVLEDEKGVCGYVLGALDSETFFSRYLTEWLPEIQTKVPEPQGNPRNWSATDRLYYDVYHPDVALPNILESYPSHLHIDLLPRAQGVGNGKRMMLTLLDTLRKKASPAVHLGMHPTNERAFRFYINLGFHVIEDSALDTGTLYMGRTL